MSIQTQIGTFQVDNTISLLALFFATSLVSPFLLCPKNIYDGKIKKFEFKYSPVISSTIALASKGENVHFTLGIIYVHTPKDFVRDVEQEFDRFAILFYFYVSNENAEDSLNKF